MQRIFKLMLVPAVALLSACATSGVDRHYGEAWETVQSAQIYNVRAGDDSPVLGMDQVQQMRSLQSMRGDIADRQVVKAAPLINITQSTGGSGGGGGGQ